MRKLSLLLPIALIGGCSLLDKITAENNCTDQCYTDDDYEYKNTHKIDKFLKNNFDTCIIFNKTEYQTGFKKLTQNPFKNEDPFSTNNGYSTSKINLIPRNYDNDFNNYNCEKPINIKRKINIYSVSVPDYCIKSEYAGSIYTNSTSTYNSYSNSMNTYNSSMPIYNYDSVPCIKTYFLTELKFYKGEEYLGIIKDKLWTMNDYKETINYYSYKFRDILEFERIKNDTNTNIK